MAEYQTAETVLGTDDPRRIERMNVLGCGVSASERQAPIEDIAYLAACMTVELD